MQSTFFYKKKLITILLLLSAALVTVFLSVRGGGVSGVGGWLTMPVTTLENPWDSDDPEDSLVGPNGNGGMNTRQGGGEGDGGVDQAQEGDNSEEGSSTKPIINTEPRINHPPRKPSNKKNRQQQRYVVPTEEDLAEGAPLGRSTNRSWPLNTLMPVDEVRAYFKDTLLIIMMSPPRYHLVNEVKKHYEQYFQHIFFCGPRNNSEFGVDIKGYDIVYGNEQYRAVNRILREHYMTKADQSASGAVSGKLGGEMESGGPPPPGAEEGAADASGNRWKVFLGSSNASYRTPHNTPDKASLTGMLYVSDDVITQPWSLAARGLNLNIPWASQMGIANTVVDSAVNAVPAMSVEGKFRARWNYWKKNRPKMFAAISEAGEMYKYRLALAAKSTHPRIFKWSKYKGRHLSKESNEEDRKSWEASHSPSVLPFINNYRQYQWASFFTIVDSYYVPRSMWGDYCEASDLMAKFWVFGELAIATTLRFLHPVAEEMGIQYYWASLSAEECIRSRWDLLNSDGIHRCRHDHKFVQLIFSNDTVRSAIAANLNGEKNNALTVSGLIDVPYEALKNVKR